MTGDSSEALPTVASIQDKVDAARPPHGDEWDLHTVVDQRVHISRTAADQPVIFIEGDDDSFGNYGRFPGARHVRAKDMDTGRLFETLQVAAPSESRGGAKALAHIVYEMASFLRSNPTASNEDLLLAVRWVLGLLGTDRDVLTVRAQLGLAGECRFLRELLDLGLRDGFGAATVLERWVDAERDFAARGISVEVKTTAQNTRVHHIDSITQLEPSAAAEIVYLYSIGMKSEALHDRKLTAYVDDVVRGLVTPQGQPDSQARARFFEMLESRGYYEAQRALYDVGPGLMLNGDLPARLYRTSELDYLRIGSFKNETLPAMVRNIGYDLELPDGLSHRVDERAVFRSLIRSHPV
jgi:Putative  PD-(D/E)XK family member, (DUF4420)